MTKDAEDVYLGWGNRNSAVYVEDARVVVLIDRSGDEIRSAVLEGEDCDRFLSDVGSLTRHLTGVLRSARASEILRSVESHPHYLNAYNAVFERHFADVLTPEGASADVADDDPGPDM